MSDAREQRRRATPDDDATARRLACTEFRRPLLVEAGAGTGKTTTLVQRIVCWAVGPGWDLSAAWLAGQGGTVDDERIAGRVLERVVAITFTEAAAAEMARRTGAMLGGLARGERPRHLPEGVLPGDAEDVARRARALAGVIDRLVVRTIHGFCRRLLSRHAIEAGLAPGFAVDADLSRISALAHELVAERAPELLADDDAVSRLDALFAHGIDLEDIERALVALTAADEPAERLLRPDEQAAVDTLRSALLDAGRALDEVVAPLREARGGRRVKDELAARELADLLEALGTVRPDAPDAFERIVAAASACETLPGCLATWSSRPDRMSGTARKALGEQALARLPEPALRFRGLLDDVRRLRPDLARAARELLAPLLEELELRVAHAGLAGFDTLLARTAELLSDARIAAEVRGRIDQLLVDEVQDTDALQYEIVRRLALDGADESRPGLFVVGDPKQSIYAFRGADLAAYDEFRELIVEEGGARHRLCVNFRSRRRILDEVERLLAPVMRERKGVQPGFEPLHAGRTDGAAPGEVEYWVCWQADENGRAAPENTRAAEAVELEARTIARDIRDRHGAGTPWSAFAILLRSGSDIDVYLQALRDEDVPYAVTRDRNYFRRREVIDAAALVRAVVDPSDSLALVATLRSVAGGLPDAALLPLWDENLPAIASRIGPDDPAALDAALAAVRRAAARVDALAPGIPGIERLGHWPSGVSAALTHLAELRTSFRVDPPEVFVEKLRALSLLEPLEGSRYLGAFRLANLERLFDDVLAALGDERADPETLLRTLRRSVAELLEAEEARPEAAAREAVTVTTIHGAKGLGFDHVYVAQLQHGRRARGGADGSTRVRRRARCRGVELFGEPDAGALLARLQERDAADAERARLLYVATTRAKERLVLCATPHGGNAGRDESLLGAIRPVLDDEPLDARWKEARAAGTSVVHDGPRSWRFPALDRRTPRRTPARTARPDREPPVDAWLESADRLAAARRAAAAHERRPVGAPLSEEAHALLREQLAARDESDSGLPEVVAPDDAERVARAAGTLVHRALERLPLGEPLHRALAREIARLPQAATALGLPDPIAERAADRAAELLERFAGGPLGALFERIAPHVVGREVPLVVPPAPQDASGPVGYRAGVIDLLYRDPDSGDLVVADYKTDETPDARALDRRATAYAPQVGAYRDALERLAAPGRTVRAELWFLAAGERREIAR
ncbi:MAG: hypothetical protein D6738_07485 [Acidobacteria bacterium]|nr:MAG: hypothetical protein D6738_07485 [Acidobacteriota bacterium]